MRSQDRKGYEENKKAFHEKLPEGIIPLTEYITWKKPITVYCQKCGRTHTYSEARYAVTRRCHGCYLNEIRQASKEKLLDILKKQDMSLVDWPDGTLATLSCNKCGSQFKRKVDDVINRGFTSCMNCKKLTTEQKPRKKNHYGLTEEQIAESKKKREAVRKQRLKAELDELIGKYILDYDVVRVYDDLQNVVLRCRACGHEFLTQKTRMKKGYGCAICSKRGISKASQEIENYLRINGIPFEREKRFDECRRKNPLPFDFFVPSMNLLIEYNGEQHYRATELFGGEKKLELYRERDKIKRQFAKDHGFRLLVIPWYKEPVPMLREAINRE